MKIIRNFIPPKDSTPYNPAQMVVIGSGDSRDITLSGMGGGMFGVKKILPYAKDMSKIRVSVRVNEDLYLFRDILLSTVHTLFKSIDGLHAPFIIQKNHRIVFELENVGDEEQAVNIQIIGYDGSALTKLRQAYQDAGEPMPVPRFLYGHSTVPANATNVDLGVKSKSNDVVVHRMAMGSDKPDGSILSTIQVYSNTVRRDVFISQLNDEFDGGYANVPFVVGSNVPFTIFASNLTEEDAEVSFLCESYQR
jgi:hypothetical protein